MQIKREFEMSVTAHRRFVIHRSPAVDMLEHCAICGEPKITVEQGSKLFGISQRRVFQIIEAGTAHFTEAESGEVTICLTSLAAALDIGDRR